MKKDLYDPYYDKKEDNEKSQYKKYKKINIFKTEREINAFNKILQHIIQKDLFIFFKVRCSDIFDFYDNKDYFMKNSFDFVLIDKDFKKIIKILDLYENKKYKLSHYKYWIIQDKDICVYKDNLAKIKKEKDLFTMSEKYFFISLYEILKNRYIWIFSKVRLSSFIEVDNLKLLNKINKKHIDFIIVSRIDFSIICLIELDWSSHNYGYITKKNDLFKNILFQELWIPFIRFNVSERRDKNQLMNIINKKIW